MRNCATQVPFVLLLCCLMHGMAAAQAWHPFPAGQVSLFTFVDGTMSDTALFGARIDSVALEGQDSAFYLYRIARPVWNLEFNCAGQVVQNGAHATNRDHYFGRKLLRAPNGDCRFVLSNSDTFHLRSLAPVGDSWEWTPGDTATVDSVALRSVLGVLDSVKYIHTQGGTHIALSQAHGLVSFPSLYPFHTLYLLTPIPTQFDLWGIPSLALGGRLPTYAEIGLLDVGDRLGYYQSSYSASFGSIVSYVNCTVTSQVSGTRFSYTATCDTFKVVTQYPANIPDSTYHPAGPQVLSIDSLSMPDLNLLPWDDGANDASGIVQAGTYLMAGTGGRVRSHFRLLYNWDDCSQAYLVQPVYISQQAYATGLMQVLSRSMASNSNSGYELYCYQKGSESWGTCLELSGLIAVSPAIPGNVEVSPIPASTMLRVSSLGGSSLQSADLVGLDGRVVASVLREGDEMEIDVSGLPVGIYLLRVQDAAASVSCRRVLVAR